MKKSIFSLAAILLASFVGAQGTAADYQRANEYRQWVTGKVLNANLAINWTEDGGLWYRAERRSGGSEFVRVGPGGAKGPAFDHAALASNLSADLGRAVDPTKLPIERLTWDGEVVRFRVGPQGYEFNTKSASLSRVTLAAGTTNAIHPADMPRVSGSGGENTIITFINSLSEEVDIAWLTLEGERTIYHRVPSGGRVSQNTYSGHAWLVLKTNGEAISGFIAQEGGTTAIIDGTPGRRQRPTGGTQTNPGDLRFRVTFENHQATVRSPNGNEIVFTTTDGTESNPYGGQISLSPNGRFLALRRNTVVSTRQIPIFTSRPADQFYPTWRLIDYVKPGDDLSQTTFTIVDTELRTARVIPRDLYQDQYNVYRPTWSRDGNEFRFMFNERGHKVLRWIGFDTQNGQTRAIIDEVAPNFVDYSQKFYLREIPGTDEAIWMSERSGWNHLYRIDTRTGAVKNAITSGEWVVREVVSADDENSTFLLRVFGMNSGEDPYHSHFIRVGYDGKGLVRLTEADGNHSIEFSEDGRTYVDTYSRVDMPQRRELRSVQDGRKLADLEPADASALTDSGWKMPVRFTAIGRDGVTDIWGYISFPSTYDPARKYPVIEQIYAGPHGNHVRKSFAASDGQGPLAELGFIVVYIDGMGTNWRSRAFHDVCWQNIADAGFPDRMLWIKAAAAAHPSMDLTRVGITGGSAGGQNTAHALLLHGDFYKVGVADCGCYDNRMDKIWWNEAWMGKVGPHYEAQSCATLAPNLEGDLMILLGEGDTNVDPASTYQLLAALNAANKDYEFILVPGAGHGTTGNPVIRRRVWDFFVRKLHAVEPRRTDQ
ncbi:MAG: prolyl oligopeptidase family serine peptidase [Fimbriimonadaceae bacterium]|nr:prolyl oligopeptidase family serine peptidase [Fimbriimonadaceae bacterium]